MAKSVTEYREIGKKRDGGRLDASFTVEAALVMSALFLFIASLITGVFDIHAWQEIWFCRRRWNVAPVWRRDRHCLKWRAMHSRITGDISGAEEEIFH